MVTAGLGPGARVRGPGPGARVRGPGPGARVQPCGQPDFDWVLRYLSQPQDPCLPGSVGGLLPVLAAAHHYLCPGLAAQVAARLAPLVSHSTCLAILQEVTLRCPSSAPASPAPAPRPASPVLRPPGPAPALTPEPAACCRALHKQLLDFADRHASRLLASEAIGRLELPVLQLLVSRSTLHIKSEVEVAAAVARWARADCRRRGGEETEAQARQGLRGVQYLVRYLTLTPDQFLSCPAAPPSPLLTEEEADALHYSIVRRGAALPDHLAPLRTLMSEARGPPGCRLEVGLVPVAEGPAGPATLDRNMRKLQELREKELAYKDNYSIFDEMFMCFRCLFD